MQGNAVALQALVAEYSEREACDARDAAAYVEILNGVERSVIGTLAWRLLGGARDDRLTPRAMQVAAARYAVAKDHFASCVIDAAREAGISLTRQVAAHWVMGGSFEPEIHTDYGANTLPVRLMLVEVGEVLLGQKPKPSSVFSEAMIASLEPTPKTLRQRKCAVRTVRRLNSSVPEVVPAMVA